MNAAELRHQETSELAAQAEALQEELFRLRMQHHTGQLDKSSRLRETRRAIARIKTVLRQRSQAQQGAK